MQIYLYFAIQVHNLFTSYPLKYCLDTLSIASNLPFLKHPNPNRPQLCQLKSYFLHI